jgi:hypothetical protein
MSDIQPVTLPNLFKESLLVCGFGVKGVSVVQCDVLCQQH